MSDVITIDDTRGLLQTRLDQSIDDPHSILEVIVTGNEEFYDAYAVVAVQKRVDVAEEGYHHWELTVHKMKVTLWGDILDDKIIIDVYDT